MRVDDHPPGFVDVSVLLAEVNCGKIFKKQARDRHLKLWTNQKPPCLINITPLAAGLTHTAATDADCRHLIRKVTGVVKLRIDDKLARLVYVSPSTNRF